MDHHAAVLALFRGATEGLGVHITDDWKDPLVQRRFDGPELIIAPGDAILRCSDLIRAWFCAEKNEHEATAPYLRAQVLAEGADPARAEHPWEPIVLIQTMSVGTCLTDAENSPTHTRVYTRVSISQGFADPLPDDRRQRCHEIIAILSQIKEMCGYFNANRYMIPL